MWLQLTLGERIFQPSLCHHSIQKLTQSNLKEICCLCNTSTSVKHFHYASADIRPLSSYNTVAHPSDIAGFAGLAPLCWSALAVVSVPQDVSHSSTRTFYPSTHSKGQRYHTECMMWEIQMLLPRPETIVWFCIISNLFKTFNMSPTGLWGTHTVLLCWVFCYWN